MAEKPPEDFDWQEQVGARPFRLRPKNRGWAELAGFVVSQIVGLGSLALITLFFTHFDLSRMGDLGSWTAGILGFSQFFLVPFGMGFVGAYFWLDEKEKRSGLGKTFLNTLLSCLGAAFILREGAICLFMAFLFLWIAMAVGYNVGEHFWRKNPFLSASLIPIFLMLVWTEVSFPATQTFSTSTDFHSKASPAQLWRYTASYPQNTHPPTGWLYSLGMPAPAACQGAPVVGGRRDCALTGGVSVGSRIVEAEPNRRLVFAIDRQPQHPEITHHFVLEQGQIDLIPDGRGGTVIRGTSRYRLNVAPMAYFSWWSAAVVHQTHWRVFQWMDELATRESRVASAHRSN